MNPARTRFVIVLLAAATVAATLVPVAAAQLSGIGALQGATHAVGQFAVAPRAAGLAQADGLVTRTLVSEFTSGGSGAGVVQDFSVLGAPVLDAVSIANFQATKSLAGQGTSVLTLEGTNAVLQAFDNINALLMIQNQAKGTLSVAADLAAGVTATAQSAQAVAVDAQGRIQGSFVVVNTAGGAARGAIDAAMLSRGVVEAQLASGEALVFRAVPSYDVGADAEAVIQAASSAIVGAMAAGQLAGEVTSEFKGAQSLLAEARYDRDVRLDTSSDVKGRVETTVRAVASGAAGGAQVIAYDLDYPDLPAASADQVAVYVDGVLAGQASSATHVTAAAEQAAYWAGSIEGRTLVLVNTGASAAAAAQRTITIAAVPDAAYAARTLAQLNAALGVTSDVQGEYRDYAGARGAGDVAGEFTSFFVSEADGLVQTYALVEQGTAVFESIDWEGQGSAEAALDEQLAHRYHVGGTVADLEFNDAVVATILARVQADAMGHYELADDVQASLVSEHVVELTSGADVIGHLVFAHAKDVDVAGSHFSLGAAGEVVAHAAAGTTVLFRSVAQAESEARARMIAEAFASGDLASQIDVGVVGNAVESATFDASGETAVHVKQAVRGEVHAALKGEVQHASAILINADRQSLVAASPDDIQVLVDEEQAYRVSSLTEAYASATAQGRAAFAVLAAAHGAHQVVVAVPKALVQAGADVAVKSTLEARNRANAAVDIFGSLHLDSTTGAATGAVVSFVAKTQASAVLDYTVTTQAATTTVFDAVVVGDGTFDILSSVQAPSVRLVNPEASMEIFDATSALMHITADTDTSAAFDLAAQIEAVQKSDTMVMLNQASGGATTTIGALVVAQAHGAADASSHLDASAAGQVTATLAQGATLIFRAYSGFEAELDEAQKEALAEAIAQGRVAGQVIYSTKAAASAGMTLTGHATMELVQGVDIVTKTASATQIEVLIDSAHNVGRTVILSLDPGTISGLVAGNAELLVDGKAVQQASSYFDVLTTADDAGADEYYVHTTETGNQVLVSLAHFSTRSISITEPEGPSYWLWSTIGLGLVVAGQAVYPRLRGRFE